MSKKALEAFEEIWKDFHFKGHNKERYLRSVIVKALKPPTADEVCEVLGKHTMFLTAYDKHKKEFFDSNGYICYLSNGRIYFNDFALPPHLITLIGKFYEGVEYERKQQIR